MRDCPIPELDSDRIHGDTERQSLAVHLCGRSSKAEGGMEDG